MKAVRVMRRVRKLLGTGLIVFGCLYIFGIMGTSDAVGLSMSEIFSSIFNGSISIVLGLIIRS